MGHPSNAKFPSLHRALLRLIRNRGTGIVSAMTYPRSSLVPPGAPGLYHCVSRCVRRAFLCGADRISGRSFEHRRQWVEDRLHALARVFSVSIWSYAVMSNHLHVVVQVLPEVASQWSEREVAERWVGLFPRADMNPQLRVDLLAMHSERVALLRSRLADLSWFMRCLAEPIARRANKEDSCTGRFWEGRYKCQALLDDTAVLAAMAYVDLNPIRAGMCDQLEASDHTSAVQRIHEIEANPSAARHALAPLVGIKGRSVLRMSQAQYLELLDFTGRQLRADKRGVITGPTPEVLRKQGADPDRWTRRVMATGSGFHRAIGDVESLIDKAKAMGHGP